MRSAASLLLAAAVALPLQAQAGRDLPRPDLGANADTNDASFYLVQGHRLLDKEPQKAVAMFRWAGKVDPTSPDAAYGERVAILLSDVNRLVFYMKDDAKTMAQPDIKRADSLEAIALRRSPLFYRRYDRLVLMSFARQASIRRIQMREGANAIDRSELEYELGKWFANDAPTWMKAWFAYSDGDFARSAQLWRDAMKGVKEADRAEMYAERARAFAQAGMLDSAVAMQRLALSVQQKNDEERLTTVRESRAEREYILGALLAARGDTAGATEAYGRALTENLGYYPAHRALAEFAMARGDAKAAGEEYRQAIEVAGDEAGLRYGHGIALVTAGQALEASQELTKATELAPLWAEPWLLLARLYDQSEMTAEAKAHYEGFLARASQTHRARGFVDERLKALGAVAAK